MLGIAPSTVHRWLNDGFIAGEQLTPGATWRIRITEDLRSRFVEEPPEGYVPIVDAMRSLSASRQTVLQRVRLGALAPLLPSPGVRWEGPPVPDGWDSIATLTGGESPDRFEELGRVHPLEP